MRKKDLIQLGVTGVLAIVLILVWANASARMRHSRSKSGDVLSGGPAGSLAIPLGQASNSADNNHLYDLLEQQSKSIELKRDPFTASPIVSEKSLHSELSLTGILWDKEKPLAIINGNVVKKGQRVGNKTIMDIRRDRVIFSDGQILSEIRLEH